MSIPTADDVADRLGRCLTDAETLRVDALIGDAVAVVQNYTGQDIGAVEDDTVRLRVVNRRVVLPQRPVTAVTAVANDAEEPVAFEWHGGARVDITGACVEFVTVTYSHGYDTWPAAIVAVICQVVARSLGVSPEAAGITQESVGSYSYTIGSAAGAGVAGLLAAERELLDRYRPTRAGFTVPVGSWL